MIYFDFFDRLSTVYSSCTLYTEVLISVVNKVHVKVLQLSLYVFSVLQYKIFDCTFMTSRICTCIVMLSNHLHHFFVFADDCQAELPLLFNDCFNYALFLTSLAFPVALNVDVGT